MINWIDAKVEPDKIGKYVVETITSFGNKHKFECYWNGKSWSVSNQKVVKWLKED